MADITATAAQAACDYPQRALIRPFIAAATILAGQSVYQNSLGNVDLCSSGASGTRQFLGIALNGGAAGQVIGVCMEGEVNGFNLSDIAYDGVVYQSDNAGSLATAAGTTSVVVGRVIADSSSNLTKKLYVQRKWTALW